MEQFKKKFQETTTLLLALNSQEMPKIITAFPW